MALRTRPTVSSSSGPTVSNFTTALFHGLVTAALALLVFGAALYAYRRGGDPELLLLVVALWGAQHGYYMREHTQEEKKVGTVASLLPWNWSIGSILDWVVPLITAAAVYYVVKLFIE